MPAACWVPAYVALGSNLDDPLQQVAAAFQALRQLPQTRLVLRSRCYRTRPLGPQDQPDYINAAAGLLTLLSARALFTHLQAIETALGRTRDGRRWGPRRIDLDLLLYGELTLAEADLSIPHPGLAQRNFVLYPLCDIAPSLTPPGQPSIQTLAARVEATGLVPLESFDD